MWKQHFRGVWRFLIVGRHLDAVRDGFTEGLVPPSTCPDGCEGLGDCVCYTAEYLILLSDPQFLFFKEYFSLFSRRKRQDVAHRVGHHDCEHYLAGQLLFTSLGRSGPRTGFVFIVGIEFGDQPRHYDQLR